jgi:hypothetical protein
MPQDCASRRGQIEVNRNAGVELYLFEDTCQCVRGWIETVAIGADRTGHDQHQTGGAVLQVLQCLRVRGRRVRMVDTLYQRPTRPWHASDHGLCPSRPWIEWLYPQVVVGPAYQPLVEWGTFERGFDQPPPFRFRRRRELTCEGHFVGHAGKMAQSARSSHCVRATCMPFLRR